MVAFVATKPTKKHTTTANRKEHKHTIDNLANRKCSGGGIQTKKQEAAKRKTTNE